MAAEAITNPVSSSSDILNPLAVAVGGVFDEGASNHSIRSDYTPTGRARLEGVVRFGLKSCEDR
jgi:hypothetical protein